VFAPLYEEYEEHEQGADEAPDAWRAAARCRDGAATLTGLFFSEELHDIARAKAVCSKCTVREPCLSGALARREPWGVWGGELVLNGKVLAQKRRRGRPPKHPRPELVVDEVPIPPHLRTA
jgi:WhiB family transcriptional regulator, redox-sensing transcriptional regulator